MTYSHRIKISSPNLKAVIDVSCFKAVKSLTLEVGPTRLSSSSPINVSSTLTRLRIGGNIQPFVNCFDHLRELTVRSSEVVKKVDIFGCIPILRLFYLFNVDSLVGLGYDDDVTNKRRNREVLIFGLDKVKDFTPLNTIPIVTIGNCEGFVDLGQVKDVKNLSIWDCSNILPPLVPMKAEQVTLTGTIKHSLLLHFANVKVLNISQVSGSNKWSLEGLESLVHLERVDIFRTTSWKEQESKVWVRWEDYSKNIPGLHYVIYVKKTS